MMRIEPNQISHRLAAMLLKVGRGDLTRTGFDVHEDALERSKRHESDPDRALFHALFDKGAPHNAPGLIGGVKAWAQDVSYVQFMLTVLVVLVATQSARCQPSQNLVVRGQNGSTTQFTRSAGLLDFKCDGTTVICSWNSTTSTWTITAAGGGGGTPGGSNCQVQYNNSNAFGGASDFCFNAATGEVSINDDASAAPIHTSVNAFSSIVTYSGSTDLNGLAGMLGQSIVNSGTTTTSFGVSYAAVVNGGNVTAQNEGAQIGAFNFSGVPITGQQAGIEVGVGNDSGALVTYGIVLDDNGGPVDAGGNPVYAIYQMGVNNNSVVEGNLAIDGTASVGGLSIAGHACTLVAGVPHCP